jgi:hypothetical protein
MFVKQYSNKKIAGLKQEKISTAALRQANQVTNARSVAQLSHADETAQPSSFNINLAD